MVHNVLELYLCVSLTPCNSESYFRFGQEFLYIFGNTSIIKYVYIFLELITAFHVFIKEFTFFLRLLIFFYSEPLKTVWLMGLKFQEGQSKQINLTDSIEQFCNLSKLILDNNV